jgi:hypothetical protein
VLAAWVQAEEAWAASLGSLSDVLLRPLGSLADATTAQLEVRLGSVGAPLPCYSPGGVT